jgi:hypothetical protein
VKLFTFFLLVLIFSGCQQPEHQENLSGKSQVQILLNNKKYDQAIALVHQDLQIKPNDSELLFFLVSSLVGKAGIDMSTIFPILKKTLMEKRMEAMVIESSLVEKQTLEELIRSNEDEKDPNQTAINTFLIRFIDLFNNLGSTLAVVAMLPKLNSEQEIYSLEAFSILKDHQFEGIYENYAYQFQAVLSGTLFVNILKKYISVDSFVLKDYFCGIGLLQLKTDLENISYYIHIFNEQRFQFGSEVKALIKLDHMLNEFLENHGDWGIASLTALGILKDRLCF